MKTCTQQPPPGALAPPAGILSPRGTTSIALRQRGPTLWAAFVTALLFLFLAAPAARADQNPPGCTGSGLGITLFTSSPDVHIGDTLFYSVTVYNGSGTGPVVCDATDIKAFVVTPDGVSHPLTLTRTSLSNGQSDFYPNVVSYVVRAQDIQSDGTVRATASDTGIIHQNDTNSQGGGNQGVNTEVSLPCILLAVQCVGSIGENGAIAFTGTVTNCGNNTLVGVTVSNFVNGVTIPVTFITNLARGQVASFSGSYVPANPCVPSVATFTAQGIDQFTTNPRTVSTTSSTTCAAVVTPGIVVTTKCPPGPVGPGQLLVYSGSVSNTGNVTLVNITVVSDQPVANSPVFTLATLAPGAVASFTGSYLAPTNCATTETVTARAASVCGVAVASTASATCPILTTPRVALSVLCPVANPVSGGPVTYTGTVRNTGDITLNNVVVTSDRPAANTTVFTVATLAPGATATFTTSLTAPANACTLITTFAATGRDQCTTTSVSDSLVATCIITTAPAIAVTLVCPVTPVATGGLITYTGTVRNSGNVTLNNVTVLNNQVVPATVLTVPSLAPGASANFTASFTTPADTCSISSTVTATGTDACSAVLVSNTASATCALITTPRIVISQNCPIGIVNLGGLLTYSGSVSNAGNVTLTNVTVLNDRSGGTAVFTAATLAPGATANFTGSYTVPANNGCSITSTSTASGSDKCTGARVNAGATSTCSLAGNPQLAVSLSCPATAVPLGGTLIFSGTVSNPGNVTLTNVIVRRDAPFSGTPVFTIASLAPGASANFTGSYTVPALDACASTTTVTASANDQCAGVVIGAGNSISCPLVTTPRLIVAQVCPPSPAATGGLLNYSGSVSNAGNVTLTNVLVTSSQAPGSPVFAVASLAPGASANFVASFVAPLDACSVNNTLAASSRDQCSGLAVTDSITTTCPLVTAPQIAVTKLCPPQPVVAGAMLVYTGTVTNTGNVTLNNVMVVNSQPSANTVVFGPVTLAPGAGTNFTGSYLAPLNACSVTDTLVASGRDKCTSATVTNAVSVTCPINTQPLVAITLVCPPTPVATGSLITYTGTVRNSGNVTLNNVIVVNNQAQPPTVITVAILAPGASTNFTTSFLSPANACSLTTVVTVQGADSCNGLLASNTATATCPVVTAPGIAITEECPAVPATAGGLFTYSGTVRNTGNITLTNVTVFNNRNTLLPGGMVGLWNLNETSANVANDTSGFGNHGNIINAVRVNGLSGNALNFDGSSATVAIPNSASLNFSGPITLFAVVKPFSTNGLQDIIAHGYRSVTPAGAVFLRINNGKYEVGSWDGTDSPTASAAMPAGDIGNFVTLAGVYNGSSWTLYRNGVIIANAASQVGSVLVDAPWALGSRGGGGERFLNGVIDEARVYNRALGVGEIGGSVEPTGATPVFTIASLAPGASASYSGSFTLPLDAGCSVTSAVTVGGADICTGTRVSANATITCPLATVPDIEVTQFCPGGPILQGSILTYTGLVRNTGNSTLLNVVVTSDRPATNTVIFTVASLAPGATASFSGSYKVPTNCCVVASTVMATGKDCNNIAVSDTDTAVCTVTTTPRIVVTKVCPPRAVEPGELLRYSGSVSNAGDIVLINVTVVNNQLGTGALLLGPITLAPGESVPYTAAYIVPADFCGLDTVTARGLDACVFAPAVDSISTFCTVTLTPRIAVTKDCPVTPTVPGGIFTYTGQVSNPGNVTLTNVFVYNSQPTNSTLVIGPITLAPGESRAFSGSYTAPHCCCLIVDTLTASGRDRCAGTTVSATASSACPMFSTPGIAVTQTCPAQPVGVGGVFSYTGTVSNTGGGVLTNVFVLSSQGGVNVTVLGPLELAAGESKTFSGSYTVTANSNPGVNLLIASGTGVCSVRTVTARANCAGPVLQQLAQPVITQVVVAGGVATITWTATPGGNYVLQSKATPSNPVWTDVAGSVTATGSTASKSEPVVAGQSRVYRVKAMPLE